MICGLKTQKKNTKLFLGKNNKASSAAAFFRTKFKLVVKKIDIVLAFGARTIKSMAVMQIIRVLQTKSAADKKYIEAVSTVIRDFFSSQSG